MVQIWDVNREAVEAFVALETQWRVVAAGFGASVLIRLGLDYAALDFVLKRLGFEGVRIFRDVQVMEASALAVFREAEA